MKAAVPNQKIKVWFGLVLFFIILTACQPVSPAASDTKAAQNNQQNPSSWLLSDPTLGLNTLKSYKVTLDKNNKGQLKGKPFERHTQIEHSLINQTGDEDRSLEINTIGEDPFYFRSIRLAGAVYNVAQQDFRCSGSLLDPTQALFTPEASLLAPVSKADRVGDETVNGINATHYHFDQVGYPGSDQVVLVSGEMWIANQGGFIVKYTLKLAAPAQPDANGLQVSQSMVYEISQVNSIDQLQLPEGCNQVPYDLPMMSNAAKISLGSGYMHYNTSSAVSQVIELYQKKLPDMGWKAEKSAQTADQPESQALPFSLTYNRGNQRIEIDINSASGGGLDVNLMLVTHAALASTPTPSMTEATASPSVKSTLQATTSPSESGLPADVPLYPGATGLKNFNGKIVMFNTSDAGKKVSDFYLSQLKLNGWKLINEITVRGQTIQTWSKDHRNLMVMTGPKDNLTSVMINFSG